MATFYEFEGERYEGVQWTGLGSHGMAAALSAEQAPELKGEERAGAGWVTDSDGQNGQLVQPGDIVLTRRQDGVVRALVMPNTDFRKDGGKLLANVPDGFVSVAASADDAEANRLKIDREIDRQVQERADRAKEQAEAAETSDAEDKERAKRAAARAEARKHADADRAEQRKHEEEEAAILEGENKARAERATKRDGERRKSFADRMPPAPTPGDPPEPPDAETAHRNTTAGPRAATNEAPQAIPPVEETKGHQAGSFAEAAEMEKELADQKKPAKEPEPAANPELTHRNVTAGPKAAPDEATQNVPKSRTAARVKG